jgi:hypothetical protein
MSRKRQADCFVNNQQKQWLINKVLFYRTNNFANADLPRFHIRSNHAGTPGVLMISPLFGAT